jgi:predicted transposase YdaD
MLDYFVRLVREYDVPITQIVIFLLPTSNEIAFTEAYVSEMTTHRYRVIRMWGGFSVDKCGQPCLGDPKIRTTFFVDGCPHLSRLSAAEQDSALFLNNVGLLPLAPLARTDSPQVLLSQVAQSIAKISDRVTRQNTAAYTEILAGLRFEKDLIRQLLREDIMQESVIYQDILQKGEEKGEQKGEKKEAFSFCLRLLNQRFGELDSSIIERVRVLSVDQLEDLGVALLNISQTSDFLAWLDEQERS